MQPDAKLIRELLIRLHEIEASKQPGDTLRPVQPSSQTLNVPNGFSIPGYSGAQVDEHLEVLVDKGLVVGEKLPWGIKFDRLTRDGRALI